MIIEGKIVNADSETYGQIEIGHSGFIEKIGPRLGAVDLKTPGYIFPGFIDIHVHAREDASGMQNYKEDFRSMSEAALHGGVVAVADMPNNRIVPVSEELFFAKQALVKNSLVDVLLYGAILPGSRPLQHNIPYKVFMGPSIGDIFFPSFAELSETIGYYRGKSVSFHCEDPAILRKHEGAATHEQARPREAEISAVEFALELAREYELEAKICHVSTAEALEKISLAKRQGLSVTCEVAPHHLYFDESNISEGQRKFLQVNPPLRSPKDRAALIIGLRSGAIDFLASDHAPHTIEEKKQGISGIPHLDTFGAFTTWLMSEQDFSPSDVARVAAGNPGKFFEKFTGDQFGQMKRGAPASLTIVEPESPQRIKQTDLKTKCGWSPFEGAEFPGRVTHTIVRGKVYEN